VIFIDSNIPMYLLGSAHPHKADARRLLEEAIAAGDRLVTSAEVLQELLHRYSAIGRREAIQPAFDALRGVADDVFPVTPADVERAKDLLLGHPDLSARDALHVAVMQHHEVSRVMSFDGGFDEIPGITRIA